MVFPELLFKRLQSHKYSIEQNNLAIFYTDKKTRVYELIYLCHANLNVLSYAYNQNLIEIYDVILRHNNVLNKSSNIECSLYVLVVASVYDIYMFVNF